MTWKRLFGRGRTRERRLRLFGWALAIGLLFGVADIGQPLEENLRVLRNRLNRQDASGDIVIVAIDDRSLEKVGRWPWPRSRHAELVDRLTELGARRIFFDIGFSSPSNPRDDARFAKAIADAKGRVVLPVTFNDDAVTTTRVPTLPLPMLRRQARLASSNLSYGYNNAVWKFEYLVSIGGKKYPSFASSLSRKDVPKVGRSTIDYSIDPSTIPVYSAYDVINSDAHLAEFARKDVIIGVTSYQFGEYFFAPGYGRLPRTYFHVLAADTLKNHSAINFGWLLPFLIAGLIAGVSLVFVRQASLVIGVLGSLAAGYIILAVALTPPFLISVVPAFAFLLILTGGVSWAHFRRSYAEQGTINPISGLLNLNALRQEEVSHDRPLIVARVLNYAEVTSALPATDEKKLVEQIAKRLSFGAAEQRLHHGDEGIFAWFAEEGAARSIGDRLEALHSMFRGPVVVADAPIDLSLTFGIDAGSDRSVANRLGSALVAADEAAAEGLRWKSYDPAKLKDAVWKLSLLSQLDAAIESGDFWIAYQPKLDLATQRIVGAEALARWTHPDKGPISPAEFIAAAEQHDRIERLTAHVLDGALKASAALRGRGVDFGIAVNLSARLIGNPGLFDEVQALLSRHGLPADALTLEVTETAALTTSAEHLETLERLRRTGVHISIDDYGTGLSTLGYLKKIPATEIKIDRSFIETMNRNQSDRLLVNSTIQLAHSLGHRVVAEGVEDQATLDALAAMGCDLVQGFLVGAPMSFRAISRLLLEERRKRAA